MVPSSWRRQLAGTMKVQVAHLAVHVAEGGSFLTAGRQMASAASGVDRGRGRRVLMGLTEARRAAVLDRNGRYFTRMAEAWATDLGVPEHAVIQFRNEFAAKWVPTPSRRRAAA